MHTHPPSLLELDTVNGIATVTSLQIAAHFVKNHDDVLRDIGALLKKLHLIGTDHLENFEKCFHQAPDERGVTRNMPYYRLTQDGFTLLSMGFTGDLALCRKLAYIAAFNHVRKQLALQAMLDGDPPESKQDAISFLELLRICNKSYDAANLLSYLLRQTALGMADEAGCIELDIPTIAGTLGLDRFELPTQIAFLERNDLVDVRRDFDECTALRVRLANVRLALGNRPVGLDASANEPRFGLTRHLNQLELRC